MESEAALVATAANKNEKNVGIENSNIDKNNVNLSIKSGNLNKIENNGINEESIHVNLSNDVNNANVLNLDPESKATDENNNINDLKTCHNEFESESKTIDKKENQIDYNPYVIVFECDRYKWQTKKDSYVYFFALFCLCHLFVSACTFDILAHTKQNKTNNQLNRRSINCSVWLRINFKRIKISSCK